jgi:hypothetical protein
MKLQVRPHLQKHYFLAFMKYNQIMKLRYSYLCVQLSFAKLMHRNFGILSIRIQMEQELQNSVNVIFKCIRAVSGKAPTFGFKIKQIPTSFTVCNNRVTTAMKYNRCWLQNHTSLSHDASAQLGYPLIHPY